MPTSPQPESSPGAGSDSGASDPSREDEFVVRRCVCFDVSFEELRDGCRERGIRDLQGIRDEFGCGSGCGMCVPYVTLMLRTGRTRFRVDEAADA